MALFKKQYLIFSMLIALISCAAEESSDKGSSDTYTIIKNGSVAQVIFGDELVIEAEAVDPDGIKAATLWKNGVYDNLLDTTEPYSFIVKDLPVGEYFYTVRTQDTLGNELKSKPLTVTVLEASYVSITAPSEGASLESGKDVVVIVEAFDSDGIDAARLWVDGTYHSIDKTAPYSFTLTGLSAGEHTISVRTRDILDNLLSSEDVQFTLVEPAPVDTPYVVITAPAEGSSIEFGQDVVIMADAFDPDGIDAARLRINNSFHSVDKTAPYSFTVNDLAVGENALTVRTTDELGNTLDSAPININVFAVATPYTTITSPSDNTAVDDGDEIVVDVDAFDSDGINQVSLLLDGSVYSSDTSAPYRFTLTNLGVGEHTLIARSQDSKGNLLSSTSLTVNVLAVDPPYVNITAPTASSSITFGQDVIVNADAFDTDGIDAARLWLDGSYYGIDKTAPYSFSIPNLPVGEHTVTVRTRDSLGNLLSSETVTFNVASNPVPYTVITSPKGSASIDFGDELIINADAFDPDGINAVRLWVDGSYYGIDKTNPYSFTVSGLTVGEHSLFVRSKDSLDNALDSTAVSVTVKSITPPSVTSVQLPIEVLGAEGVEETVSFNLTSTNNVTHLYLKCNACGYHDINLDKGSKTKATVSINGGAPIALKHFTESDRIYGNANMTILGGAAHYGGIGGAFRTVAMTIPISGLKIGKNTLSFKHQDAVAPSIGFRIVDLNLLKSGDLNNKVLGADQLVKDDPSNWQAPLSAAADVAKGKQLWNAENSLYDPWFDGLDGRTGGGSISGNIKASCASCHAASGRDLKYFNFSNKSIVKRSEFHGLSEKEGEQIASYIRSIDIPVVDQARPWEPTYQPGPGMDERDVYEWAAGAGIDAVLENDKDMAPYLLPKGNSLDEVRKVVDRYNTLNMRELPINIPMPEWNQWLPILHPDDAFDSSSAAVNKDHLGNNVGMPYYQNLYNKAVANPSSGNIGRITIFTKRWLKAGMTCQTNGPGSGEPLRGLNGDVLESISFELDGRTPTVVTAANCRDLSESPLLERNEIAKRGLTAWTSVKMWELIHGNDLEEQSKTMNNPVCSVGRCIDASEPKGWNAIGRNVFDRPPHFVGVGGDRSYFSQNEMLGVMESNSWYHLNLVVNPGYRQAMPSHFAYLYSHVQLLQEESGIDQGYRYWATLIKQRQLQTSGEYGIENGLDLRTAEPYVYYGTARNSTKTDTHASVGQPLWGRLAQSMIEDLTADSSNNDAKAGWAAAKGNYTVQKANSTNFSPCGSSCTFDIGDVQGRNTYRVIPKLREIGVQETAIDDLIDWGVYHWPNGPWNTLRKP